MPATYSVRLRERGQLTLPRAVRDFMAVGQGDMLSLVQIDDIVVLSARQALIPKLSEEFTAIMEDEGISLAELLQGLETERELIWTEKQAGDA
ncbi:MAG: hypothetical protein U9R25_02745 [Chloroflexota bacterium]|nr:hypothetical protein [Chloroflexota bacterium]